MQRDIHFRRHGHEFGVGTAAEYEQMADAFLFGAMNADTHECFRPNGNLRDRMDFVTVHFGVAIRVRPVVATFYIPTPNTVARHGGVAQLFLDYCARPD
jgi:pyocin large subunit-like protein